MRFTASFRMNQHLCKFIYICKPVYTCNFLLYNIAWWQLYSTAQGVSLPSHLLKIFPNMQATCFLCIAVWNVNVVYLTIYYYGVIWDNSHNIIHYHRAFNHRTNKKHRFSSYRIKKYTTSVHERSLLLLNLG